MALVSAVVAFSLRQASIESGEKVVEKVREWFVDPGLDLHKAIKKANDRTWYAMTLALGGDGWLDRARGLWAAADVRGVRDQVQAFLRHAGMGMDALPQKFRKNCLDELKRLKAAGRLNFDSFDPAQIGLRAKDFRRYDDPTALAQEARRAVHQMAVELVREAPNLAELLQLPLAGDDKPLLVTAFSYFLRQEMAGKPELAHGMMLDAAERLYAGQASGFKALDTMLGGMDTYLHQMSELVVIEFDEIRDDLGKTRVAVDDTHRSVQMMMDLIREQQKRISDQEAAARKDRAEMRRLMQLLLDTVSVRRGSGTAYASPHPFADFEREQQDDREAVERMLDRSPLTSSVRALMGEALDEELASRRVARRGEYPAGARKEGPHGMTLVWVPPGSFFMGSPDSEPCRDPDEFPHHVTLTAGFWMAAHPVTRRQWWSLMRNMPDDRPADDHPVEGVSWDEANEFLDALAWDTLGKYRLPTEAEWEYACRAGTVTPFSFGFRLSGELANYHASEEGDLSAPPTVRRQRTTPTGSFPPNAWGLYDMHGNVMEWCADWYGPYDLNHVVDPAGPALGESRVLRGGGWWSAVHACRSARRYAARPDTIVLPAGFRVVLLDQ